MRKFINIINESEVSPKDAPFTFNMAALGIVPISAQQAKTASAQIDALYAAADQEGVDQRTAERLLSLIKKLKAKVAARANSKTVIAEAPQDLNIRKENGMVVLTISEKQAGEIAEAMNHLGMWYAERHHYSTSQPMRQFGLDLKAALSHLTEGHSFPLVKDGDFTDPALKSEDNGDEKVETDFDKFKTSQDAGDPDSAQEVEGSSKAEAEEVGKTLNAKDMAIFSKGYQKLCAGAIESISAPEAKELAEIMLALFKSKIEEPAIEESNQDNKLARDAAAAGQPAPENPNAPKSPAQMMADKANAEAQANAETTKTNNQNTGQTNNQKPNQTPNQNQPADDTDQETGGQEAADVLRRKGIPVKR